MRHIREIMSHKSVEPVAVNATGGAFIVRHRDKRFKAIVGLGDGWEHVSVSQYSKNPKRVPNYQEMKAIKRVFFREDEWAVEYHPSVSEYKSVNPWVLHIWRPTDVELPIPPSYMV